MAPQTLLILWFGNTWFTKPCKYNGVRANGSPNITYTMVWGHMAHQGIQIQWFDGPRLTKRYVYIGFGDAWLTKPYKYIGVIPHGLPSVTYTMMWGRIAHQTLQIQWFENQWVITHDVYNGLRTHKYNCSNVRGSPNVTCTKVCGHMAHQTLQI